MLPPSKHWLPSRKLVSNGPGPGNHCLSLIEKYDLVKKPCVPCRTMYYRKRKPRALSRKNIKPDLSCTISSFHLEYILKNVVQKIKHSNLMKIKLLEQFCNSNSIYLISIYKVIFGLTYHRGYLLQQVRQIKTYLPELSWKVRLTPLT